MPLSREVLERQLSSARKALAQQAETLGKAGVEQSKFSKYPAYRELSANCLKISRRLNAVAVIEKNNELVAARKAGTEAAE
ncbi:hypothetical protein Plim_3936 [Planctopirus limnophila DSM 3776]|uniref:Uncharacterized protein n=3 Tax=Planctopirus TaxID=1649480 RepID=D5SXC5_PLAL2|nr:MULTISPECIES: hypothetical protein [Planctopirus]ADG69747.1 hypothetical protein Plim_3936 [Planctopirus limnophila DSM 3776]ODA36504.1 hypothetical protein A6X21_02135 [Planctopirus hydrillae]QDV28633.1 hypothetical protein Spb1_04970 [Planctopirus ephydatiae]